MRLQELIKEAASRKVRAKMLDIMEKNPKKYMGYLDKVTEWTDVKDEHDFHSAIRMARRDLEGRDRPNDLSSRYLGVREPVYHQAMREAKEKAKSPAMSYMNVYNVADAKHYPKKISPEYPHIMLDVFNKQDVKERLERDKFESVDELVQANLSKGYSKPDFERVAKAKYLEDRYVGRIVKPENPRKDLESDVNLYSRSANRKKNTPERRQEYKDRAAAAQRVALKLPKGKALPVEGTPIELESGDYMKKIPNMVFKGGRKRPDDKKPRDAASLWVSPDPEVSEGYTGTRTKGTWYIQTKNPQLKKEFQSWVTPPKKEFFKSYGGAGAESTPVEESSEYVRPEPRSKYHNFVMQGGLKGAIGRAATKVKATLPGAARKAAPAIASGVVLGAAGLIGNILKKRSQ
jgi:hypothetical protein